MKLDDSLLRTDQINKRKEATTKSTKHEIEKLNVGDTVKIKNKSDKHKASEMFLVTSTNNDKVGIQKLLHPLNKTPTKIMSKVYQTAPKHLTLIHKPEHPEIENDDQAMFQSKPEPNKSWSPINQKFFNDDSDSDDEEEHYVLCTREVGI